MVPPRRLSSAAIRQRLSSPTEACSEAEWKRFAEAFRLAESILNGDEAMRPIQTTSVQLASRTDHLEGVSQQPSRVIAIESAMFMERAMEIEPTSKALEH